MLNTRISVRTSWLNFFLVKWSRTGLDSSSSFGQDRCGFCGKLENYFSFCTRNDDENNFPKILQVVQLKKMG